MPVLMKIAVRNLLQHKTKTIIIGSILMVGMIIVVMGNSFVNTITESISQNYIESFSGDMIISARSPKPVSLFSIEAGGRGGFSEPIQPVPDYDSIKTYLGQDDRISAFSPQAATFGMMSMGERGRAGGILFGIDPVEYQRMFPDNLTLTAGAFLKPGEEGMLLSPRALENLERTMGGKPRIGDKIQLTGTSATGAVKIREVTIRGFFSFKKATAELNAVSLVDTNTVRGLYGMTVGAGETTTLDASDLRFLDASVDSLFGDASSVDETIESIAASVMDFENLLGDTSRRDALSRTDSGAYHYILVRLERGASYAAVQRDLERFFNENEIDARISPWLDGAGAVAKMAYNIKMIFQAIIVTIAVVAVIIIMNTLVISVSERIPEIGTIRALGGTKAFVLRMIIIETLILSVVAGLAGLIISSAAVIVSGAVGIHVSNDLLRVLLGGAEFHPLLDLKTMLVAFEIILGVGLVSAAYPVSIAVAISPVTAMQTD